MLWLHVHNAGGTSIRSLAERHGERPLRPASGNWNLWLHSKETERTVDCVAKVALFRQQPLASWTMIERPFDESDGACGEWLDYGVTLRQPVATMLSTLVNNAVPADLLFDVLEKRRGRSIRDVSLPHRGFLNDGLGHFDNYLVRTLNGREVMRDVRLGEVTEAHLERAIERLRAFDVILFLDETDGLDTSALRERRGWPAADSGDARRYNNHSDASKRSALASGRNDTAGDALRARPASVFRRPRESSIFREASQMPLARASRADRPSSDRRPTAGEARLETLRSLSRLDVRLIARPRRLSFFSRGRAVADEALPVAGRGARALGRAARRRRVGRRGGRALPPRRGGASPRSHAEATC